MGSCCSSDTVPDAPDSIKTDPNDKNPISVEVAAYGTFGGCRDFGIWEGKRPTGSTEQKNSVWLWFNKSDLPGGNVRIDLENFQRGHSSDDPQKGKVLYYATMSERPSFQHFARVAGAGRESFWGFWKENSYLEPEDSYYANCSKHIGQFNHIQNHRIMGHVIAKWQTVTKAEFHDGSQGRGEEKMKGKPIEMEVFAKGTVVRTYLQWTEVDDGRMTTKHDSFTSEFVDRIEYKLTYENKLWTQFCAEGDSNFSNADPTIESSLFRTTLEGGWFKRATFATSTKDGVDPALALLISHVCATEYSVAQLKADLRLPLPHGFPGDVLYLNNGIQGMTLNYQPTATSGTFAW
ncbi:hypothetical protein EON65_27955 [archaeon]|nr:MAG: hypothetical protein EON65_27955 [archaeon]